MKRLQSKKDLKSYTYMKQVLQNLELVDTDYWWLISDIEAYPKKEKYENMLIHNDYLLLTTKEFVCMLNEEDFQWIWSVFSAIPSKYTKDEILKYELPKIQPFNCNYSLSDKNPKIQHPLAEIEIGAWDSSEMFIVTEKEKLLNNFKKHYPLFKETTNY